MGGAEGNQNGKTGTSLVDKKSSRTIQYRMGGAAGNQNDKDNILRSYQTT